MPTAHDRHRLAVRDRPTALGSLMCSTSSSSAKLLDQDAVCDHLPGIEMPKELPKLQAQPLMHHNCPVKKASWPVQEPQQTHLPCYSPAARDASLTNAEVVDLPNISASQSRALNGDFDSTQAGTSLSRTCSSNPFHGTGNPFASSGNPFAEVMPLHVNPLFGQQLYSHASLPLWCPMQGRQAGPPALTSALQQQPASMSSALSSPCSSHSNASGFALSPASSGWLSPFRPAPVGQLGAIEATWTSKALDPCAEVLINSFAEYSKDILLAPEPLAPMRASRSSLSRPSE